MATLADLHRRGMSPADSEPAVNCSQQCFDPMLALNPEFFECTADCTSGSSFLTQLPYLLFAVVLVLFSGMFSGLTLGLLSLSLEGLDIVIKGGSSDEGVAPANGPTR